MVLTSVTPGTLRSCGRITQSCSVRLGIGVDGVHEDLAEPGGDGPQLRIQPLGDLRFDLLQALGDLLPGEVDVGAVLEHHGHLREPVA
jgi:hypothetical protein